jgi:Lrp/AsnC family leucine-responsive transcriptional regulator
MASQQLDKTDRLLLRLLTEDSRASAAGLAQAVGLTRQAVADRLTRLKQEGVLERFTVAVAPDSLGLALRAFIAITLLPACSEKHERAVLALLEGSPWVQECYRVTGDDYFLARVVTSDIAAVRQLVLDLRATGVVQGTRTTLALETLFEKSTANYSEVLDCEL